MQKYRPSVKGLRKDRVTVRSEIGGLKSLQFYPMAKSSANDPVVMFCFPCGCRLYE